MSEFTRQEKFIAIAPGKDIFTVVYTPDTTPKANLLVTHGYDEHCGRYTFLAEFFAQKGYQVLLYDLPGHGRSYGARCHIGHYDTYLQTMDFVLHYFEENFGKYFLFLFGHSMGGLITSLYLEKPAPENLKAAALSGPYLDCSIPMPTPVKAFADFMGRILPRAGIKSTFTGKDVTQNPEIITAYDNDTLRSRRTTFGWFHASNRAQAQVQSDFNKISTPLLCWAGDEDKLAATDTTEKLMAQLKGDKEFRRCQKCYHEVLNEKEYRQSGLEAILAWYEKYLG